jgi:hypothetical protein
VRLLKVFRPGLGCLCHLADLVRDEEARHRIWAQPQTHHSRAEVLASPTLVNQHGDLVAEDSWVQTLGTEE